MDEGEKVIESVGKDQETVEAKSVNTHWWGRFFGSSKGEGGRSVETQAISDQPRDTEKRRINRTLLKPGEVFEGGMPFVTDEAKRTYEKQMLERYGEPVSEGKYGSVYVDKEIGIAYKVFKDPRDTTNAYEVEFMREYGGKDSLPKFEGVTVNGYAMEAISGESIKSLLDKKSDELKSPPQYAGIYKIYDSEVRRQIVTLEVAQKIIDSLAEFHIVTGRPHADALDWSNFMITEEGEIAILDPNWQMVGHGVDGNGSRIVWEDVGSVFNTTPYEELFGMHSSFKYVDGYELRLPNTIKFDDGRDPDNIEYAEPAAGAIKSFADFVGGVRRNIIRSPLDGMVGDFINRTVDVKVEGGQLFVSELQSKNS
jgi:hypothetical protein